mmetsp:Transcript_13337/g.16601  ORF Transcript_13337/g.16601 Transcript_13337/m.16601 type:complete len:114 (-) Transcript_13337:423-764(-)
MDKCNCAATYMGDMIVLFVNMYLCRMLEQKLSMATMALRRLETSFQLEFASTKADAQFDNVNVQENVNALKSFFEETFSQHRANQEKVVGKKLKHIQQTLRRKKTKNKRPSLY